MLLVLTVQAWVKLLVKFALQEVKPTRSLQLAPHLARLAALVNILPLLHKRANRVLPGVTQSVQSAPQGLLHV